MELLFLFFPSFGQFYFWGSHLFHMDFKICGALVYSLSCFKVMSRLWQAECCSHIFALSPNPHVCCCWLLLILIIWESWYFLLFKYGTPFIFVFLFFSAIPPGLWDPSSSTSYWAQPHSSERAESYPLACQGIPMMRFLKDWIEVQPFLIGRVLHNWAFLRCARHFRLITECYI